MKQALLPVAGACVICGGAIRMRVTSWHKNANRTRYVYECRDCGFLRILENHWDYAEVGFTEKSTSGPRVGRDDWEGRETKMAAMGIDILKRDELDVLIIGSGMSRDWKHIDARPEVRSVTTTDLKNFNESPNFRPLDVRGGRTYDLVLACEVAEHFTEPKQHMADLCADVAPDGLAVLSTNIYDGSELSRQWYPFIAGHVAYYTPDALQELGDQNGMHVDFRVPEVAFTTAGPRKRYVLMTRQESLLRNAAAYFGRRRYAPSEHDPKPTRNEVVRKSLARRLRARIRREWRRWKALGA